MLVTSLSSSALPRFKAACLMIADREAYTMKADSNGGYQLSLSSKLDIQKVILFFSSSNHHPLLGYKYNQYTQWLSILKNSKRYSEIVK